MGDNSAQTFSNIGSSLGKTFTQNNVTSALGVGSGLLSAVGKITQGNAAQEAADAQATALDRQSSQTFQAALAQAGKIRKTGAQTESAATAALGASGVNVNQGSAGLVRDQIDQNAQNDALVAIASGSRQAATLQTQAQLTRQQGASAARAGRLSALASGLNSFSKWKRASSASNYSTQGASGGDGFDNQDNYG